MAWDGASMRKAEAVADADTAHVVADLCRSRDVDASLLTALAPTAWDGTRNAGGAFVMVVPSAAARSRMRQQATADTRYAGKGRYGDTASITPSTWRASKSRNWDGGSPATVPRRPVVDRRKWQKWQKWQTDDEAEAADGKTRDQI